MGKHKTSDDYNDRYMFWLVWIFCFLVVLLICNGIIQLQSEVTPAFKIVAVSFLVGLVGFLFSCVMCVICMVKAWLLGRRERKRW